MIYFIFHSHPSIQADIYFHSLSGPQGQYKPTSTVLTKLIDHMWFYGCGTFLALFRLVQPMCNCLIYSAYLEGSDSKAVRYSLRFLSLPGVYASAPATSTLTANNVAPATRRVTALAIGFMITNCGAI